MRSRKMRENITEFHLEIRSRIQALWNCKNKTEDFNSRLTTIIMEETEKWWKREEIWICKVRIGRLANLCYRHLHGHIKCFFNTHRARFYTAITLLVRYFRERVHHLAWWIFEQVQYTQTLGYNDLSLTTSKQFNLPNFAHKAWIIPVLGYLGIFQWSCMLWSSLLAEIIMKSPPWCLRFKSVSGSEL